MPLIIIQLNEPTLKVFNIHGRRFGPFWAKLPPIISLLFLDTYRLTDRAIENDGPKRMMNFKRPNSNIIHLHIPRK